MSQLEYTTALPPYGGRVYYSNSPLCTASYLKSPRLHMTMGIGVDIEKISDFKKNFKDMIFTEEERRYCDKKKNPLQSYTGKFCAKEAVIKASSTPLSVKDIEILNDEKPYVKIKGEINTAIKCSISHSGEYAIAFVIWD